MVRRHKKTINYKFGIIGLVIIFLALFAVWIGNHSFALLNPKGIIALKEYHLMVTAVLLMLIVVVPVFFMTFFIAWKYRADNPKAKYEPNLDRNAEFEFIRWAAPGVIILILAVITWKSTHLLDPSKAIESSTPAVTIQVIALEWKWLFIYPQQKIATVNFVEFPEGTPINFMLTADAPMNSFWIPQLGGQMYAMAGMSTHMHLMASESGEFAGSAAEINGRGFAGMKFIAKAVSKQEFDTWIRSAQRSPDKLDLAAYNKLAEESENNPTEIYASATKDLFSTVIKKFMAPSSSMPGMNMGDME